MTDTYESFLGPIHPGFYKSPSHENQKLYRELGNKLALDECWVTFTISHPTLQSSKITELLELEPNYTLEDGDDIYKSDRHHIKQNGSRWSYELYHQGHHKTAEDLLASLLDNLSGKLPKIRLLQEQDARMKIRVEFDQHSNLACLELKPELLIRLAQLRVNFEVLAKLPIDNNHDKEY